MVKKEWTITAGVTTICTGLTNNILFDSFILPLAIACLLVWLFRSRIIAFEEWLDTKKDRYKGYKAEKMLQLKVARIKAKEFKGR